MRANQCWLRECGHWFLYKFRSQLLHQIASGPTVTIRPASMVPGLDIVTVQKLMGHGDLASTMRYVRAAEAQQTQ